MTDWLGFEKWFAFLVAGLLAFLLRAGSLYFGWQSPEPYDLTPVVTSMPGKVVRTGRRAIGRRETPP